MVLNEHDYEVLANLQGKYLADFACDRIVKSISKSRKNGTPTPENLKEIHKIEERVVSINNNYGEALHNKLVKNKLLKTGQKVDIDIEKRKTYERVGKGDVLLRCLKNGGLYVKVHKKLAHTFPEYLTVIWTDKDYNIIPYETVQEYAESKHLLENDTTVKQQRYGLSPDEEVDYKTYQIENVKKLRFKVVTWKKKPNVKWEDTTKTKAEKIDKKILLEVNINQISPKLRAIIEDVHRAQQVNALMDEHAISEDCNEEK